MKTTPKKFKEKQFSPREKFITKINWKNALQVGSNEIFMMKIRLQSALNKNFASLWTVEKFIATKRETPTTRSRHILHEFISRLINFKSFSPQILEEI
jgi:hypothetical protein